MKQNKKNRASGTGTNNSRYTGDFILQYGDNTDFPMKANFLEWKFTPPTDGRRNARRNGQSCTWTGESHGWKLTRFSNSRNSTSPSRRQSNHGSRNSPEANVAHIMSPLGEETIDLDTSSIESSKSILQTMENNYSIQKI